MYYSPPYKLALHAPPSTIAMASSTCFPNHPNSLYQLISTYSLHPMLRGSMYEAYSELREWKLRIKRSPLVSSQACSPFSNYTPNYLVRKENNKPIYAPNLPPATPRRDSLPVTPSRPKTEFGRPCISETNKREEKRGGGLITMKKSYSSVKEMKELNDIHEEAKVVNNKTLKRCVANFRLLAVTKTTSLS